MAKGNITQRERALRVMFDYFLYVISNSSFPPETWAYQTWLDRYGHPLSECPLSGIKYAHDINGCYDWCGLLWPELLKNTFGYTVCPCHFWGRAKAFRKLKSLLRKEGFIDEKE